MSYPRRLICQLNVYIFKKILHPFFPSGSQLLKYRRTKATMKLFSLTCAVVIIVLLLSSHFCWVHCSKQEILTFYFLSYFVSSSVAWEIFYYLRSPSLILMSTICNIWLFLSSLKAYIDPIICNMMATHCK